ncbi:MAG: hypothetical protein ACJ72N_07005 [Labedaea sp.]
MTASLFDIEPTQTTPAAGENLSTDRRRTIRQAEFLAGGRHPLTAVLTRPLPLHVDAAPVDDRKAPGLRCGSCRYRVVVGWHSRSYPKCTFGARGVRYLDDAPRVSHGGGTDCRAWWPACRDYQPKEAG